MAPDEPVRLNRYIAQAGICSRRKADEMIEKGHVKINGEKVDVLGTKVQPTDVVEVSGKVITPRAWEYFILNKPPDTITTTSDEKGRKTVMDLLTIPDEEKEGIYPIGRLDRHTVGVLLLTNDGEFANRLMHPRYDIEKVYVVRTREAVSQEHLAQLVKGIELEDGLARADNAHYLDESNLFEIGIALHEGKNRQIRRMLEALGYTVEHLERVRYAGLTTKGIRRGRWRRMQKEEVKKIRKLIKLI